MVTAPCRAGHQDLAPLNPRRTLSALAQRLLVLCLPISWSEAARCADRSLRHAVLFPTAGLILSPRTPAPLRLSIIIARHMI